MMPWQYVPLVTSQENPLTARDGWYKAKNAPFDISMREFLRKQGATEAMIELAYDTIPTYGLNAARHLGADDGVRVGVHPGAEVGKARDAAGAGRQPGVPRAMARNCKQEVRLNQTVKAIDRPAGDEVRCGPRTQRYSARALICAVPFTTLRRIDLRPASTARRPSGEVAALPAHPPGCAPGRRGPSGKSDGLEPSMWTDSPIGRVSAIYHGARTTRCRASWSRRSARAPGISTGSARKARRASSSRRSNRCGRRRKAPAAA